MLSPALSAFGRVSNAERQQGRLGRRLVISQPKAKDSAITELPIARLGAPQGLKASFDGSFQHFRFTQWKRYRNRAPTRASC
jgi:hypothetical protein